MRQHFRGVVLPLGKTKGAYIRSDGINEYTNPAKYLSEEDYSSKMLAATELDGVDFGYDTADVLADLGYSEAEIKGFFDKGISVSRQDACPQYKHL